MNRFSPSVSHYDDKKEIDRKFRILAVHTRRPYSYPKRNTKPKIPHIRVSSIHKKKRF